jgi:hypothetical protein
LSPPVLQGLAGPIDFSLLPLFAWIPALVVAAEEKHDPRSMEMHKDAEDDRLPWADPLFQVSEHLFNLIGIMANSKLVKTLPKRFEPFRSGEIKSPLCRTMRMAASRATNLASESLLNREVNGCVPLASS